MKAYIYWLHLSEHTSYSNGYIGVSRNHQNRFKNHKKRALKGTHQNQHLQSAFQIYGERIEKHVIWLGEETGCYKIEEELRSKKYMGWNINKGGTSPPNTKGIKNLGTARRGNQRTEKQKACSDSKKGKPNPSHSKKLKEKYSNMTLQERTQKFGAQNKGKSWKINNEGKREWY